jgi:hypothetical protein
MRWAMLWAAALGLLIAAPVSPLSAARHESELALNGPDFPVSGVVFTLPTKWIAETAGNPARAGQWRVPPPRGQTGEPGEIVAFYFGPKSGGTAKENIDAWMGTMFNVDGRPAAAEVKNRTAPAGKISQVVAFGTYSEVVPIAGIPPLPKPNYGLVGTVIETAQGNIYWRFTGPEPLITADLALFNKMIDSVKVRGKAGAP